MDLLKPSPTSDAVAPQGWWGRGTYDYLVNRFDNTPTPRLSKNKFLNKMDLMNGFIEIVCGGGLCAFEGDHGVFE